MACILLITVVNEDNVTIIPIPITVAGAIAIVAIAIAIAGGSSGASTLCTAINSSRRLPLRCGRLSINGRMTSCRPTRTRTRTRTPTRTCSCAGPRAAAANSPCASTNSPHPDNRLHFLANRQRQNPRFQRLQQRDVHHPEHHPVHPSLEPRGSQQVKRAIHQPQY